MVKTTTVTDSPTLEDNGCKSCVTSAKLQKITTSCSDGEDNDGNGFTDCDDFSCSRNPDVTVCGPRDPEDNDEACSDGIDNDSNDFIDCELWLLTQ